MPNPNGQIDRIHLATYGDVDGCFFATQQVSWLRPVPTFSRVGPVCPPRTLMGMLGGLVERRSASMGLYHVIARVGGRAREGYVVLTDEEASPCLNWHPPDLPRVRSAAIDLLDSYGAERRARQMRYPPG